MTTLAEIEVATKRLADVREKLSDAVAALNAEFEDSRRRHIRGIKDLSAALAEKASILASMIEGSPELFQKPRTLVLHGIKVGFTKGKGVIAWEDEDQVIKMIRAKFPEQADVLIRIRETPNKTALLELPVAELKKIGCTVEETGDVVVIKPVDGEVEKMVKALLAEAMDKE
jgi:hypothetical protein